MWFLVIFTGYWIVFWQQYISLPGYIHGYINSDADVEMILVTDGLTVICSHPGGQFPDAQDSRLSRHHSGHGDHLALLADPRIPADDLGRRASLCSSWPWAKSFSTALLRIHFAPRASGPARHLHGLCLSPYRHRLADRRLVRRIAAASLRRSRTSADDDLVLD